MGGSTRSRQTATAADTLEVNVSPRHEGGTQVAAGGGHVCHSAMAADRGCNQVVFLLTMTETTALRGRANAATNPRERAPATRRAMIWLDVLHRLTPLDSNPGPHLGSRRTELRFTVRRPASAEVSPCCHRPSGGDVACGVDVSMARPRTTGDALEDRLALAVFRGDMPAVGASLRRVRCRDELEPPRGLVLEPGHQQSPPVAADLAVEAAFLRDVGARAIAGTTRRAGHRTHIQVFDADGVEAARQIGGGFLHPVTAAIGFAGAQPCHGQLCSCTPVRSASRPRQALLQSAQSFGLSSTKTGRVQQFPAGQRHRDRHAAVHTHHAAIIGSRDRFRDGSKSDVPAPRPIHSDSVRLHRVGYVAGPPKLDPPDLGDPDLPVAAAEPLDAARLESDLAESFMRAGLAPRRATVGAVEKVAHRLGEVPQRSPASGRYPQLLHRLRPGCQPVVFGARRGQLGTLLVVTGRTAARLPVPLLLDGEIPHKPGVTTMLGQCGRLLRAGKQPKPAHTNNLGRTTDNLPKGGKRRFLPRLKPRVSTPQI